MKWKLQALIAGTILLLACVAPTAKAQNPIGPTGYTFCANEGGSCTFSGGATSVAFGAGSSFTTLTLSSPANCNITSNGGPFTDPDEGVVKACFYKSTTAPTAPGSLTATQTAGSYTLSWTLNPLSAVVGSNGTVTATITVTMTPTTTAKVVTLKWTAPATGVVTGYNVYRSTVNGSGYTKITPAPATGTSYQDGTVVNGSNTTYYYEVTDIQGGVESGDSNQATVVVP